MDRRNQAIWYYMDILTMYNVTSLWQHSESATYGMQPVENNPRKRIIIIIMLATNE